jgi:hypothetical protein
MVIEASSEEVNHGVWLYSEKEVMRFCSWIFAMGLGLGVAN